MEAAAIAVHLGTPGTPSRGDEVTLRDGPPLQGMVIEHLKLYPPGP
jgi:hypothetical protein